MLNDRVVDAVVTDWRTAPVDERLRAMLGFLEKLTLTPNDVTYEDTAPLHEAGLTDQAIEEAIYVCFVFSLINRLADAFDFQIPDQAQLRKQTSFLYRLGYSSGVLPV